MKLVELKCKNCGAILKIDSESDEITCKYCQTTFKVDDEEKHVKLDNMEQSGYEFEKGRLRAQRERELHINQNITYNQQQKKNNKIIWLVLAWIFLLPFTATYFIIKSNKLNKNKKIVIITIMWIAFLIIGWSSNEQEIKTKKNKIIECYSQEVYDKLDKLVGIDNIEGDFESSYTCETLNLKDKNYKKIEIELSNEKELLMIKIGDETVYNINSK